MEQGNKSGKLAGLIIAVVAIVVIVALFGSLCTCFCTVGACFGPDGCASGLKPEIDEPAVFDTPAATPVEAPATPEPAEPGGAVSPLDWDGQQSAETAPDPAAWVREKKVRLKNDGTDTVTVLVLMNGSDLESEYREATEDLREMVRAKKSDRVNILVETVGTRKWDPYFGISSRRSERYRVTETGLTLVDGSLGQLDTTIPSTLSDFIRWGEQNYPADRYILLLWNHGGGPVYGFGYDEFQPYTASLTIDEMQTALSDGGVYFDLIGMDCCLMSSLEVCCALYDFCDYTLLSEDFEPSCGWSHSEWLSALSEDPAIPTPALAKTAIDASVKAAEQEGGLTLALIDEAYVALLYPAWAEFAYRNEEALLAANYSQLRQSSGRAHPRAVGGWNLGGDASLDDYCITDVLSLAENIPSDTSGALRAALEQTIAYFGATKDEKTLSGLSVTLPYGDGDLYDELRRVFLNAGIDADYVTWLRKFVSVQTGTGFYDFGGWNGWDAYSGGYDWGGWFDLFGGTDDWDDWYAGSFGLEDIFGRLLGE
ncbi:MAG: hypothetical protein IJL62_09130 [Clostridia bacterium]|nr:hypothetical protein [Clostridia bacterium]